MAENITLNMRSNLYRAIVKKDIGWFDNRENAPGVLTNVLASEVQKLNGASSEGVAVMVESTFSLLVGLVLGFIFTWRLSLVALACVPFMMFGGAMNSKLQKGLAEFDEDSFKEAQLLASDAIINFRTIGSLNADKQIVSTYDRYLDSPTSKAIKRSHLIGFWFGVS